MGRPNGLKIYRNLLNDLQIQQILGQPAYTNPDPKAHDLFRLYGDFNGKAAQTPEPWMRDFGKMMTDQGFFLALPNQYRVCDWVGGLSAQFKWHTDNDRHGSKILVISLSDQRLIGFRKPGSKERYELPLDRGDAYMIQGPARWAWQHRVMPAGPQKSGGKSFVMSLRN